MTARQLVDLGIIAGCIGLLVFSCLEKTKLVMIFGWFIAVSVIFMTLIILLVPR